MCRIEPSPFRTSIRVLAAVGAVTVLGACELMLAESPPQAGQTCSAWRGGCVPVIDFAKEEPMPLLRSQGQIDRNVAMANHMRVPRCDTGMVICQVEGGAEVLSERYFDQVSPR